LHVATFPAQALDEVVSDINARGYGLTFGLHTRIDDRVQQVVERIHAGNIYVNRNQIGAVVGSQPFGGEGLSGTGPKAGGPHYLPRLMRPPPAWRMAPPGQESAVADGTMSAGWFADAVGTSAARLDAQAWSRSRDRLARLRAALTDALGDAAGLLFAAITPFTAGPLTLPGPTGESNQLRFASRGLAICLGPGRQAALMQAVQALAAGGSAIMILAAPAGSSEGSECLEWSGRSEQSDGRRPHAWMGHGLPLHQLDVPALPGDWTWLEQLVDFGVVACAGPGPWTRAIRQALARRDGDLKPLVTEVIDPGRYVFERLVCVDTTAAGGNAALLGAAEGAAGVAAGGM
jgi:RHH-type proline utilization regulon transcriptional repressor/proline dehydrogenase/delta 1-pyrroline-5-carboxylate dehydrogenase